jgi:acetyl esterase/lipase
MTINPKRTDSRRSRLSRRDFLKILSAVGVTAVVAGWGISQTKLIWQIGEFLALASLGGKAQNADNEAYAGSEVKLTFGEDSQQYALVFPPLETVPRRDSIVYFVHGGGWNMGNPALYRFIGRFFAGIGFPTILGGYRLAPGYHFPAQLEDVSMGLQVGMDYLMKNDAPVKRIILGGHSAGAQLVSLLAYDPKIMAAERPLFSGLVSMSGPLDFSLCQSGQIRSLLDAYIGGLSNREDADPTAYASPDIPISVLCLHGARDPLVDPENSRSFVNKINQGSIHRAELQILPNRYHSDMLNMFLEMSDETKILTDWLAKKKGFLI